MATYRKAGYRAELLLSGFSTTLGIFSGSHIGNLTDLQNAIASDKPLQNIDRFSYHIDRPYQQVAHPRSNPANHPANPPHCRRAT